jgi:uncharacterized phage-associated protein
MGHLYVDRQGFDVHKAIAAIGYLVSQTGASMYPVMKMMYLADKCHLERYGRFIAGDHYAAMQQGPVPSCAYNLVKCVRTGDEYHAGDSVVRDYFAYGERHMLHLLRDPDLDELSPSDLECLDEISQTFNRVGLGRVRDMAHDVAWEHAWAGRGGRDSTRMDIIDIAAQLDNGEALVAHLRDNAPGEAELR